MDPSSASSARAKIGNQVVSVENGVFQILFAGRVSVSEAAGVKDFVLDAGDRFGPLAALVDLDRLAEFDSGARAVFARPERPYPFFTVAYFGGSFAARMLILTIVRAGKLVSPAAFAFDIQGFATEAEARRFIETARQKRFASR